ncbi:Sec-independent protein translocase protein TatB [Pseudogemmobacter sp. W21_MBD1_M6]|uniref:Sec-independent protein translocase protein TatB n=1 Tax=Pseudogemmobacter sp. W21_MBD1_M6 TaxID=3240271 RepID=UPI003F9CFAA8
MFDIGWTELLLIGIVALIVVGPKDLPGMFHTLGRFIAKAKGMGREFQRAMDDAAKESGMADMGKDLKNMTSAKSMGLDKLKDAATKFEKWEPTKSTAPKGPATAALSEERAAMAKKISEATAKKATERLTAEAKAAKAAEAPADTTPAPAGKAQAAKKVAAKTAAKPKAAVPPKAAVNAAPKPAAKPRAKKQSGSDIA